MKTTRYSTERGERVLITEVELEGTNVRVAYNKETQAGNISFTKDGISNNVILKGNGLMKLSGLLYQIQSILSAEQTSPVEYPLRTPEYGEDIHD